MRRAAELVSFWLAVAGGAIFLALAVLTSVSVTKRWITTRPITGDFELVEIGVAVGIFFCLPWVQARAANVSVDFLSMRFPLWVQRALESFANLAYAAVAALLAWQMWLGTRDVMSYQETTMMLRIPLWWGFILGTAALAWLSATALVTAAPLSRPRRDEP